MNVDLFEYSLNVSGLLIGGLTFILIVFSRWLCIAGEYYFTKKFWIVFLIVGLLGSISSFFIDRLLISTSLAIVGFIFLWGIQETIEQEERVKKGWFPKNLKRK
ncbi:MAG: DUF4491 family protein [Bacteroidales bacterium]|nr:DUF4491 family protein [Bacteroidales bacterium]